MIEALEFQEAKKIVQELGIRNSREWFRLKNKPPGLPGNPAFYYKGKGWRGWGDFLGTSAPSSKKNLFLSYQEACEFCHSMQIRTQFEYQSIVQLGVKDLPRAPDKYYKKHGISFSWKEMLAPRFFNEEEFIKFLKNEGYVSFTKRTWNDFSRDKRPYFIPADPFKRYGISVQELNKKLSLDDLD